MKPFGYLQDRLFWSASALYGINRWMVKPLVHSPFLRGHFNDLLLIPAALPCVLWIQRRLGVRPTDAAPTFQEIALHVAVWSVISEGLGPRFGHRGTADILDCLAYTVGGAAAWVWWNRSGLAGRHSSLPPHEF